MVKGLAPVADFVADNTFPANSSAWVNFTDQSTYSPNSWLWSITPASHTYQGGTNSSSQNPTVSFDAVGTYAVSLVASNAIGADTVVKTNYIHQGIPGMWTGNTNSGWDTTTNWNNHIIPIFITTVYITPAAKNMPVKTGNLTIGTDCDSLIMGSGFTELTVTGNLTISSGEVFLVDSTGNPNIYVGGNWTAAGTFIPGQSTVILNGSVNTAISGDTLLPANFFKLEIFNSNASVVPTSEVTIDSNLYIQPNGNFTIGAGKNVTIED